MDYNVVVFLKKKPLYCTASETLAFSLDDYYFKVNVSDTRTTLMMFFKTVCLSMPMNRL